MRIVEQRRKPQGDRIFNGKVRVNIQGISTSGRSMTSSDGMPGRSITVDMTTVEEVYELINSIIRDVVAEYTEKDVATKFAERLKGGK